MLVVMVMSPVFVAVLASDRLNSVNAGGSRWVRIE